MHTRERGRKGVGVPLTPPPAVRSAVKRRSSHLYRTVLPGLCLPSGQLSCFFFHTWPILGPSPGCARTPQSRWISKGRLLGGARFIMAWHYSLTFDPQGAFLSMCSVSLVQKDEGGRSLNPFLMGGFVPSLSLPWLLPWLSPSRLYKSKHWYFPCLLLLPFCRANRRLIVNTLPGAHLSLASGNVNNSKYSACSLLLRTQCNVNKKSVVNVKPRAYLSPNSFWLVWGDITLDLICLSLIIRDASFHVSYGPVSTLFREMSIEIFGSIFLIELFMSVFYIELHELLLHFGVKSISFADHFFPLWRLSFSFG